MSEIETTRPRGLNRRQALGAVGVTVGVASATAALGSPLKPAENPKPPTIKSVARVAAVSYSMPFHDHHASGVNLRDLREMTAQVAREKVDFICYPEICACGGRGLEEGIKAACELAPYAAAVGEIAREFETAIVAPFLERSEGKVYNSVPMVDRRGKLVLNYRKNYPTIGELELGISPGRETVVAECDGVRVGAAVCFDANFDFVAADLERRRARLVFWPSMYWGGELLRHWALRYGFAIVAAYGSESSIVDMNGRYLAKQGQETFQVRRKHLPPWAVAEIRVNRELFHLDYNQDRLADIREKYGPEVEIEVMEPEGYFLLDSRRDDLTVEALAAEFGLETNRDYLARSLKKREEML